MHTIPGDVINIVWSPDPLFIVTGERRVWAKLMDGLHMGQGWNVKQGVRIISHGYSFVLRNVF